MLEQLEKLKDIADGKAKVVYFIVGLGPTVKKIRIDLKSKYGELMDECRCAGVQFVAMNLQNKKGYYCVNDFIDINFYESEKWYESTIEQMFAIITLGSLPGVI